MDQKAVFWFHSLISFVQKVKNIRFGHTYFVTLGDSSDFIELETMTFKDDFLKHFFSNFQRLHFTYATLNEFYSLDINFSHFEK